MKRFAITVLSFVILSLPMFAHAQFGSNGPGLDGFGLGLHGNWCGPSTGIQSRPPIDPLDNACMRHDICYVQSGRGDCTCDIGFMNELRNMSYPTEELEVRARAMYDAIAMTPCDDPMGWAYKQSCMWRDMAEDAVTGRAMPYEVPMRWMYLFMRSYPTY